MHRDEWHLHAYDILCGYIYSGGFAIRHFVSRQQRERNVDSRCPMWHLRYANIQDADKF